MVFFKQDIFWYLCKKSFFVSICVFAEKAITMQACMDRFKLITRLCRKIIDDKNHAHYTRFILNQLNKDTALPVIEVNPPFWN